MLKVGNRVKVISNPDQPMLKYIGEQGTVTVIAGPGSYVINFDFGVKYYYYSHELELIDLSIFKELGD